VLVKTVEVTHKTAQKFMLHMQSLSCSGKQQTDIPVVTNIKKHIICCNNAKFFFLFTMPRSPQNGLSRGTCHANPGPASLHVHLGAFYFSSLVIACVEEAFFHMQIVMFQSKGKTHLSLN